jgi:hypothetical protein
VILLAAAAWAAGVETCDVNYPIAGSAGFANAQEGRKTNRNTYSAANFAERALIDDSPEFQWVIEWNATLNAARVPTLCGDADLATAGDTKARLYEDSLDLYASNTALSFETKSVGLFYSASVTQSSMGLRYATIPTMIIQLYPLISAPFVGIWQRGDGVSSYSLDWIGGGHVDTKWFGARVGYTGIGGLYGSFDERTIGLFGTTAIPFGKKVSPWNFLRAGLDRFDPAQFGAKDVSKLVGMTSFFFRDLPFGEELDSLASGGADTEGEDEAEAKRVPVVRVLGGATGDPFGSQLEDLASVRLRTLHFEQKNIGAWVDVDISYALAPKAQVFDAMVAVHSPDYNRGRLIDQAKSRPDDVGFLVKLGMVDLPPQYALGVEGGAYFAARAELRTKHGFYFMALFNDPEQLALYPFATNAFTLRVNGTLGPE